MTNKFRDMIEDRKAAAKAARPPKPVPSAEKVAAKTAARAEFLQAKEEGKGGRDRNKAATVALNRAGRRKYDDRMLE